jgi:single-stranded DNA-binding protein
MSLHCAGYAAVIKDPEIKQSKSGSDYANIIVSIDNGTDAEGKETSLLLKLIAFSDLVDEARKLKRLDRAYFEGTANQIKVWESDRGSKPDIQVRLHHLRRTQIGKDHPRRDAESKQSFAGAIYRPAPEHAGPSYRRERPPVQGRDRFDFDDEIPFGR